MKKKFVLFFTALITLFWSMPHMTAYASQPDMVDVVAISGGASHSLALTSDGTLWACAY